MKTRPILLFWALAAVLSLASCERIVVNDLEQLQDDGDGVTVTLRVSSLSSYVEQPATTRATTDVGDVCTRLNFVVYQGGEKVKVVNQSSSDDDFGTVNVKLETGTYELLVLAHSGKQNPTLSNPEKILFDNKKTGYTDTFYYYGTLEVSEDEGQVHDLKLTRPVSMFRLVITDPKPANVTSIRVFYKGGSGTFNAVSGYGCVNSEQYMIFDVTDEQSPITLEAYTFLHYDEEEVTFSVLAYSSDGVEQEREFSNVPMYRNSITQYTGSFFTGGSSDSPITPEQPGDPTQPGSGVSEGDYTIQVDTGWSGQHDYTF